MRCRATTFAPVSARDRHAGRLAQELGRPGELDETSLVEHGDASSERDGVLERVRDQQRGQPELAQRADELVADHSAGDRVKRGERLVEQQHLRLARERAGERDALALAARELRRPDAREVRDAEAFEQVGAIAPGGETHVGGDREVREQAVVLWHVADAAALRKHANAPRRVEPELPVERDPSALGTLEPRHRAQQRALARTGAAQHGDRLVGEADRDAQLERASR